MPSRTFHQPATAAHTWQVLWIGGEIDIATVDYLRDLLHSSDDPQRDVILDLSDVTFMDCSGLGALLEAQRRLGGRFWLSGIRPPVQRLLEFTGLSHRFAILAPRSNSGLPDQERGVTGRASRRVPRPRLRWQSP